MSRGFGPSYVIVNVIHQEYVVNYKISGDNFCLEASSDFNYAVTFSSLSQGRKVLKKIFGSNPHIEDFDVVPFPS
jgi:hypothetical protein